MSLNTVKLLPPCSYQGGKQRLAVQICDIICNREGSDFVFYDLCCGSGAVSLEMINRGYSVIMVDKGPFGSVWESIGNNEFNIDIFKREIEKLPDVSEIQGYLKELSNTIGIDIVLEERESAVGKYSDDIYGREEGTDRKIVIENQLEDSNHDHLGKIITYASGKDAKTIIWIVKRARDEHRQAIEWLNAHTDEEVGFFLLEIEVWKIGDSLAAPKFNIVSKPNDWGKT